MSEDQCWHEAGGDPPRGARGERLLLVDGHGYAYRAFHAIRDLKSATGRPTNAIFGFIKMLDKARSLVQPTHLAVVWDGGLDAVRLRNLPDYKANRPEMPDDLESQLDEIDAYLQGAGILSVCRDGVEADDMIATLALRAEAAHWEVVVATSDKDFMQLVGPNIRMLNPGDKAQPVWSEAQVVSKTGVRPEQIVDWLSLVGDTVDNIPGVPGVGPKTASRLLNEFGSVEALYGALDQAGSDRLQSALKAAGPDVRRNQELVRLKGDLADPPELDECSPGVPDRARLAELFNEWGFRSMARAVAGSEAQQDLLL